jgi:hypothetical protein
MSQKGVLLQLAGTVCAAFGVCAPAALLAAPCGAVIITRYVTTSLPGCAAYGAATIHA